MNSNSRLIVAQLTDTHLFATPEQEMMGVKTAETFQQVLEHLKKLTPQPDILLLTGDLSQDETPESYQYLKNKLSPLKIPTYWLPGNHDHLLTLQQNLTGNPFDPEKSFQVGSWQFILLNSVIPGQTDGKLSATQLTGLDETLQKTSNLPTVVALHHHPLPIDSALMDQYGLQNASEFLSLISCYPQVKLVVFGHIHQEFNQKYQGVDYLGTPSTCLQLLPRQSEIVTHQTPPGFRLFYLKADGTWTTEVNRVNSEVINFGTL